MANITARDRVAKTTWEKITIEVNFGGPNGKLDESDTIQVGNCTVEVFDSEGNEVAGMVENLAVSGLSLFARLIEGEDGESYRVQYRAESDNGDRVEHNFKMIVEDP